MLDTGCLILDAGYWILDAGYLMLDTGYLMPVEDPVFSGDKIKRA